MYPAVVNFLNNSSATIARQLPTDHQEYQDLQDQEAAPKRSSSDDVGMAQVMKKRRVDTNLLQIEHGMLHTALEQPEEGSDREGKVQAVQEVPARGEPPETLPFVVLQVCSCTCFGTYSFAFYS